MNILTIAVMDLRSVVSLLFFATIGFHAQGMWAFYETTNVPIGRLFTNLEQRLARNTNSFELNYELARLHSMAYSTNLIQVLTQTKDGLPVFARPEDDAGVPRSVQSFASPRAREIALNHLTNAVTLYEQAIRLLKKSTNADAHVWLISPTHLGLAWCLDQEGRTNDAIAMYRKTLRIAWKMEVSGEFSFKQWVSDTWDDVRAGRNPIHSQRQGSRGPGVCYSEETIGYLLKLLDPIKDAAEIARLKQDQTTLSSMGRSITPILISLVEGVRFDELIDKHSTVSFDLDGSGHKHQWGWLTPKAGWLVFDPNKTGQVTSALQMFGNVTFWIFWQDGYQALSVLDDNGDGMLSGAELTGLAVWNDRNCDGLCDPGEVVAVEALGIQSIACGSQIDTNGMRWDPRGVTFTNGISRPTYDWVVWAAPDHEARTEELLFARP